MADKQYVSFELTEAHLLLLSAIEALGQIPHTIGDKHWRMLKQMEAAEWVISVDTQGVHEMFEITALGRKRLAAME